MFDLLRIGVLRRLVHARWFPYAFQVAALVVFFGLIALGWQRHPPADVPGKLYAKSNLVTLLVWGLWWPLMVFVAVWLGRAWCMVCPLELASNFAERLGRKLGVPQRKLGRWLRSGALVVVLYGVVQMFVAGAHIHRSPASTAWMLVTLLSVATVTGVVFRDRAFCRGFCPVGMLLGTYGRGGVLAVRPRAKGPCTTCQDRGCVRGAYRLRWDARSCPSLLNPAKLATNRDCLLCGQCFKSCEPDNLQLVVRLPFYRGDEREPQASWAIVAFVVMVSGFVFYELCTEWAAAKAVFLWAPQHTASALGLAADNGWIKGLWTLVVFPAGLWLVLGAVVRLAGGAATLGQAWRRLALPAVVVVAAGHMAKGVAKLSSWGGFLPGALSETDGAETAVGIAAGTTPPPQPLLSSTFVTVGAVALIVVGTAFAIREARLTDARTARRLAPAVLLLGLAAGAIALGWG